MVEGPRSVPPPPLLQVPPSGPPAPGSPLAVGLIVLGGRQTYTSPGCPGTSSYQSFVRVGATVEGPAEGGNHWQARASLVVNESGWGEPTGAAPPSPTVGAEVSASGLFEWDWAYGGLGLGVAGGAGNLGRFDPWIGIPGGSGPGVRGQLLPLVYGRLEFFRGIAFELGTGSRFQPAEGAFIGFRIGSDAQDGFAARFGLESVWLPYPLANATFFADLAIPAGKLDRLRLRCQFVPATTPQALSFSGGASLTHTF